MLGAITMKTIILSLILSNAAGQSLPPPVKIEPDMKYAVEIKGIGRFDEDTKSYAAIKACTAHVGLVSGLKAYADENGAEEFYFESWGDMIAIRFYNEQALDPLKVQAAVDAVSQCQP